MTDNETFAQRTGEDQLSERVYGAGSLAEGRLGQSGARTPRERWGTCCPSDPECDHSFLDVDDLIRWMDTPINDIQAKEITSWSSD